MDAETAQVYTEAIRRSRATVTVRVDDAQDELVARILEQTPTVDVTEREGVYRVSRWTRVALTASQIDEAARQRSA